jgi:hypothetical protein
MLGAYDFCGHYEWTFAWLEREGGEFLLREYWDKAIHEDSQRHASELILGKGIEGMKEYWGHSLGQEGAGYASSATEKTFRLDIHDCPSKGFLIRNELEQHADYCDHCIGWIGPMLKRGGFTIDHQHNHCGQCWWEMRSRLDETAPSAPGAMAGKQDIRLDAKWKPTEQTVDTFEKASRPEEKVGGPALSSSGQGWRALAPMPMENGNFACGVFEGDIVVAGGITWRNGGKIWLDGIWRFEAGKNMWSESGTLPQPIAYSAYGQTARGLHFVGGGSAADRLRGSGWLDDQFQFHRLGDVPEPLFLSGGVVVGDKLYVVGGAADAANLEAATDIFYSVDLGTGQVEKLAKFPGGKVVVPAVAALDGHIYVFAGAAPDPTNKQTLNRDDAFAYSIAKAQWKRIASFPLAVRGLASCVLDDRHILVAGGYREDFCDDAFIYDMHKNCYYKTMPLPYQAMVHLVRAGDVLYCLGGEDRMRGRSSRFYRMRWAELLTHGQHGILNANE